MSDEKSSKKDKKLLEQIRENFAACEEAEKDIRDVGLDDLKFRAGKNHWPDAIKNERIADGRPVLVINKMPQFCRQVTNDQKLNRSAIKVSPFDDNADIDTAKILQGMIKSIENRSSADLAYDSAFDGAVVKGFGYFRVITKYCDPLSFKQEILIEPIENHFSVYFDPNSKKLDGSDANFAFIHDDISKEEFESRYPDAELSKMPEFTSVGDSEGWLTEKTVRIAEYYYKKYETKKIYLFEDGSVGLESELSDEQKALAVDERETEIATVKWVKTNGVEILDETEFPCQYIPIIPVYGEKLDVDGEKIYESVIRHAKDSQRMYNAMASAENEAIALAPRAPYLVPEGQIPKEYQHIWQTANRKNHAFLPYVAYDEEGRPLPPPQRNAIEAPIGAISTSRMQSNDDIKATTGIYDASLGNKSNESSGVAIQRRTIQSQTSNYHFINNLNVSKRHCGRILVELIPKIYDTAQAVRILGEDNSEEIVKINQYFEVNGKQKIYDLSKGSYDVVIETGPSFATRRQEAAAAQAEMLGVLPQMAQVAPDLIVASQDWPGAKDISERLKKTIPPGLLDEKNKDLPPEAKAQIGQMSQMIEQLSAGLEQATKALETKQIELESKERIEMAKIQAQVAMKQADLETKEAIEGFRSQLSSLQDENLMFKQRLALLDFNEPFYGSGASGAAIQPNQSPTGGIQTPGQTNGDYL